MKPIEELRQQLDSEAQQIRKAEEGDNALASEIENMSVEEFLDSTDELREKYPNQKDFIDSTQTSVEVLKEELRGQGENKDKDRNKVDKAIQLAEKKATFFHDTTDKGYAAVEIEGRQEVLKINSRRFEQWINHQFWKSESETLSNETLSTIASNLSGRALFEGEEIELNNRTAWKEDVLWYDLADENNKAVEITQEGWEIKKPPILFERHQHQKKQVEPQKDETELEELFSILNPGLDGDQKLLFKTQLVANFIPDFPHPILCPHGPQGSGKTFTCEIIRDLIDPSELETLQYTTNLKQLTQKVSHHWFVPFDNITNLPQKVSDFLCRAVTGQGFSKRELYTDDSDIIYSFQRPIALNGINTVPQKADLLDRTILYELERIPKEDRKTEEELWRKLEESKPQLLGRIFDVISQAMGIKEDVELDWKPRMADFAEWGEAIAQAMGHKEYEFLRAYQENIDDSNVEAVQAHVFGNAILSFMDDKSKWEGTASELLEELEKTAEEENINTNQKNWPGGPNIVTRRLNEVKPNLKELGLEVNKDRKGQKGSRILIIEWSTTVSNVSTDSKTDTSDSTDDNLLHQESKIEKITDREKIRRFVEQLRTDKEPAGKQDVFEAASKHMNGDRIEGIIDQLLDDGILYEPQSGKLDIL